MDFKFLAFAVASAISLSLVASSIGCSANIAAENKPAASNLSASSESAGDMNWPLFRGNAQATGVAKGILPEKLDLLWKYTVEKGAFEATPVIVDGTVYIGDLDGMFYALNLRTGKELWKFKNPDDQTGFNTAAAVRDGLVYLGDVDGNFYCLDAANGEKKWSAKTDGEINSAANFYHQNVLFGSQDTILYCLDAKTGAERWRHKISDQIRCSPTVVENRCFLAGCDGKLHVINLNDGEETGAVDIESPTGSTPAASGSKIYFGTEGATFFCIDWKELKEIWRWHDQGRNLPIRSSAAYTPQAVIFGGRDKIVHALNPKSGEKLWDFPTKAKIDGSPVVVGSCLFIGSGDGRVYGLDLKSGMKVWEYEAGGSFSGSPAVADGRLLIANYDGTVYCLGEKK